MDDDGRNAIGYTRPSTEISHHAWHRRHSLPAGADSIPLDKTDFRFYEAGLGVKIVGGMSIWGKENNNGNRN